MSDIGQSENETQRRVIRLLVEELGYEYVGNWRQRAGNSNVEEELLTAHLSGAGYSSDEIARALEELRRCSETKGRSLYHTNQLFYQRLRYGVPVKVEAGKVTETVKVVDWEHLEKNHFAFAEEVTLKGGHERRPDLVIYLNGIAVGVIELKNSRVSIGEGIRQLISNQRPEFNEGFFSTVQLLVAGNDSAGLQYGSIGTPEKYFLKWKEDEAKDEGCLLDKYLRRMVSKERLLELMHDFVLFDGGVKKLPRVHQYFGLKEAQDFVERRESGIIWHTQGAGKSILMVLLAKWILENRSDARVVVITDRDELDKQIERVFTEAGEEIRRTRSGRELMAQLGSQKPRLLCSLVHKFGRKDVDDFEEFIRELESKPSKTVGEVFVFVDECHRTQSGKLHRAMKALMPQATFIGFTGTPLLKKDSQTTLEVFGRYIHTYKFSEAVEDGVVLDLVYEARDIDQELGSKEKIDAWFEAKTKGLNDWQRDELKKKWGTMQKVLSSRSRMDRVVSDIVFDFGTKPRLKSERGNAILVASSIYEATRYFSLFQKTHFKGRCAVVTSYDPKASDVSKEDTGENTETEKQFIFETYTELLNGVTTESGKSPTESYEDRAKKLFIKEPATMRLLIVVDKLLTGFDAPPCTYLYIDKSMQDHGLFQAICRTNRLDGEDKDFGYIVDYKDLFAKVERALAVYTSELDTSAGGEDPQVMLKDRLKKCRERLDDAIEKLHLLCEPVDEPKGELEHIRYFCGNTEIPAELEKRQPQREALYKGVVQFIRSYANLADEMAGAGYSTAEIDRIGKQLEHYRKLRDTIRQAAGEVLDLKPYEADMRHLIDTYIDAKEPRTISPFENISLVDLIVKTGIADAIAEKLANVKTPEGVAEAIENNVRKKIVKEQLTDPAFFEKMSLLLDEIIRLRKQKAIEYQEYLKRIAELVKKVVDGTEEHEAVPAMVKHSAALRALFRNLQVEKSGSKVADDETLARAELAVRIDQVVKTVKPAGFRGNTAKENVIKAALMPLLGDDVAEVERIFGIVEKQSEY
ncbi:type I restriction endonuclease subunit R [Haloferula sargassicola]|uniref:Type I restriction enzyme endonuclease subunit n=1 Tax=Haloferula sargassicola TaxID=490096 RepID=A0ABP9UR75_9BACT